MQSSRPLTSSCPLLPDVMWGDYLVIVGSALTIPATISLIISLSNQKLYLCTLHSPIINDYIIGLIAAAGSVVLIIGIATKIFGRNYFD